MPINPIARLKDYLSDPDAPTWSSQGLIDMFESLEGNMKDKMQVILPILDERLSLKGNAMTDYQYNFLRDITLHAVYSKTRVEFFPNDLNWLLNRFDEKQTQQRAALIAMLLRLNFDELLEERKLKITKLLEGTNLL